MNAVAATCNAIRHVLETAAAADNLGLGDLTFSVFSPRDFAQEPILNGVSIFLYRVMPNVTQRIPAGRLLPNGRRRRTEMPLDLHILLTVWAAVGDTTNTLIGWMMRTLEDYPTLPASVLNLGNPGAFTPDESVELLVTDMPGDELLHLWEVLGRETAYHITVPYIARVVQIESRREDVSGEPVQVRTIEMNRLVIET